MTSTFTAQISVDGASAVPGSVYTAAGLWTFGPLGADGFNAAVLLNGASAAGWSGHQFYVFDNGTLYVDGKSQWWAWNGTTFVAGHPSVLPPALPVPTAIIFTPVDIGVSSLTFTEANLATPITSITLVAGGPAEPVTVWDQTTTNEIPTANLAWQASSVVNVVQNTAAPGEYSISAVARSTPFSFSLGVTDTAQSPNVTGTLTINIVLPNITGLTFTSP